MSVNKGVFEQLTHVYYAIIDTTIHVAYFWLYARVICFYNLVIISVFLLSPVLTNCMT